MTIVDMLRQEESAWSLSFYHKGSGVAPMQCSYVVNKTLNLQGKGTRPALRNRYVLSGLSEFDMNSIQTRWLVQAGPNSVLTIAMPRREMPTRPFHVDLLITTRERL
jgi:hypothetical protein